MKVLSSHVLCWIWLNNLIMEGTSFHPCGPTAAPWSTTSCKPCFAHFSFVQLCSTVLGNIFRFGSKLPKKDTEEDLSKLEQTKSSAGVHDNQSASTFQFQILTEQTEERCWLVAMGNCSSSDFLKFPSMSSVGAIEDHIWMPIKTSDLSN